MSYPVIAPNFVYPVLLIKAKPVELKSNWLVALVASAEIFFWVEIVVVPNWSKSAVAKAVLLAWVLLATKFIYE